MASVLLAYFRTTRVQIAALLYFLIAGLLTQIPLFNYLGYEFSAVMTIPAALISGFLTLQFLPEHRAKPLTRRTWLFVIIDYFHVNFLLLLIPLFVITLNAFVVKNCNYAKGISYYLLLPIVTMIFSVSLALVIGLFFKRSKTVFLLVVVALLSHIVAITYFQPQLFAYNFILGYFPGITYDEAIGDKWTLITFRLFTIIASLLLIAIFNAGLGVISRRNSLAKNISELLSTFRTQRTAWICILAATATLITGHLYRSEIGIEHSASDIQRHLGRRSESEHFIFYYSAENYSMKEMIRLRAEAEFHYRLVSSRLALNNNRKKKIEVYLYPSSAGKLRFIGTATTNIAKPWKREIHLTAGTFDDSFRHELVHILAADFGFPIIHASTRMALNEGLAVAIDWEPGLFTPHQYAAALMREKALESVSSMFSVTGFATQSSSYAYLVCGSFCKYLIDRYGIERVKRAFPNGNFLLVFGESLESLLKDWKVFLRTVDATELPSETVKAYFFHPSIFYKICAREVAEKNQRALQALRVKNYESAEKEFSASYNDAPSVYALRGMMQSFLAQRKYDAARTAYEELPEQSLLRVQPALLYLYADACLFSGEREKALSVYLRIAEMNFSEGYIEAALLRRLMLKEHLSPAFVHALFYSGMSDSVKIDRVTKELSGQHVSNALNFLLASLLRKESPREALIVLRNVIAHSSDDELLYFAYTTAAAIEFDSGNYEQAKQQYWSAKNFLLTSSQDYFLNERIDLCDALSFAE
jgi:hypothetical protein